MAFNTVLLIIGLKGIPLLGTVLMYNKMVAGKSATSFTQLHSKFGPIYRMRMLGRLDALRWKFIQEV